MKTRALPLFCTQRKPSTNAERAPEGALAVAMQKTIVSEIRACLITSDPFSA